jgi:hypothetical protein
MEFCFEQVVEAPIERVFGFHASPTHLALLHRDCTTFRLLHHDGDVRPGCTTWFEEKLAGFLPVVLGFRHVTYEPPLRFAEELIHGPYDRFIHVHEFANHAGPGPSYATASTLPSRGSTAARSRCGCSSHPGSEPPSPHATGRCARSPPAVSSMPRGRDVDAASYILFVLGCLGAADIALYHSIAHGIRHHPGAQRELVVHALRGPTYAVLFLCVPNLAMHGAYFVAFLALLAFDGAISIWDFAIEAGSRRFLGGLPPGEYVLHVVIAMLFGALVTTVLLRAGHWALLPSRVAWEPTAAPGLLRALLAAMAPLVLVSGLQDAVAARRLREGSVRDRRAAVS